MKKIIGLVVAFVALIIGCYYGMGMLTEHTLKNNIAAINQSNGLVVNIEHYQRGLYRSQALLNWQVHVPARTIISSTGASSAIAAQDISIKMPLKIYHGPIMCTNGRCLFGLGYAYTDVPLPNIYAKQLLDKFAPTSVMPVLKLSIFVNYLNNSTIRINLPSFKLISKEGNTQLEWLGMESDIHFSSSMNHVKGHIALNGVHLIKDKMDATIGNMTSDYDLHQTDLSLYLGDANLIVPTLNVKEADQNILDINALNMQSNSDIKNNLFSSHFNAKFAKLLTKDHAYGPAALDISISNLDAAVLAKINSQANSMQDGTDVTRQQVLISVLPELPKLFSKGAKFEISTLKVDMPEGTLEGHLSISLPAADAGNPFQLIQKIEGEGRLEMSAPIIKMILIDSAKRTIRKQATVTTETSPVVIPTNVNIDQQAINKSDETLAAVVKSGLLLPQGISYVLEFKLSQGQLSINGKPFNSAMMQF